MKEVKVIKNNGTMQHTYGWSNELLSGYERCFTYIKLKDIDTINSVGGGDHILWALLHFKNIKNINHIDASKYAILFAFLKFSIIKDYSYETLISLHNRTIKLEKINQIVNESKFGKQIKKLFKNGYKGTIRNDCDRSNTYSDRSRSYITRQRFNILKERLKNIEKYHIYCCNIFTMKDSTIKNKGNSSIVMLSNAYGDGNSEKYYKDIFYCKFIITTRLLFNTDNRIRKDFGLCGSWCYYVYNLQSLYKNKEKKISLIKKLFKYK